MPQFCPEAYFPVEATLHSPHFFVGAPAELSQKSLRRGGKSFHSRRKKFSVCLRIHRPAAIQRNPAAGNTVNKPQAHEH